MTNFWRDTALQHKESYHHIKVPCKFKAGTYAPKEKALFKVCCFTVQLILSRICHIRGLLDTWQALRFFPETIVSNSTRTQTQSWTTFALTSIKISVFKLTIALNLKILTLIVKCFHILSLQSHNSISSFFSDKTNTNMIIVKVMKKLLLV